MPSQNSPAATSAASPGSEQTSFVVQGMTCASCVRRVERALVDLAGVTHASVNFATGRAEVEYDAAQVTPERLADAIEEAGYQAQRASSGHKVELDILRMTCAACVRRVETALRGVPGVTDAHVNLATKRATVQLDAAVVSPSALADAVTRAGYEVANAAQLRTSARIDPRKRARLLEDAEREEQRTIRRDFTLAAALTLPAYVLAMSHGSIAAFEAPWARWVQFLLSTPVVFGPGMRFFRHAWSALKHRSADMNSLVSLGVLASWSYSTLALFAPKLFPHGEHGAVPHLYFEVAGSIVMFVLLGKLLETRARKRLSDAVRGLVALVPQRARRLTEAGDEEVEVATLAAGDLLIVRPGERVPMDGVVVQGTATLDESLLTGESLPVDKREGASVYAGTLNQSGAITVRVTKREDESALAAIVDAVEQAQGSRAPIARLADVVSSYFVPVVLLLATATFAVWLGMDFSGHGLSVAVERFVAVLVIACPCALGLATPAAVAVGTGRGAELGVLVKGGGPLEAASRVDTVLFDKTGTLTAGKPELTDVISVDARDEAELLALVASVENASEHPIAAAIVRGARARGLTLNLVSDFVMSAGSGIEARVSGRVVRVGTAAWLEQAGVDPSRLEARAVQLAELGRTPSFVAIDDALAGLVAVADRVTDEAKHVVQAVRALGVEVAMVTGDRRGTAEAIAAEVGIARVFAEVRPEQKAQVVAEERARGRRVAMVGDGINDAPALAGADVGVAVGSGTDIAIAAADIALLRGGVEALPTALALARRTLRTIRENLFWAFIYNLVGIPLAAGLFYGSTGWLLSPVFASAAMSLSSVSVLMNSLRLRRFARQ